MRVIAGSARGRRLWAPPGLAVRPTSDRLRGALFSVLGARVSGATVWDACTGTGAVGIEALSRGAARAVFSDSARAALAALRANLAATGLDALATVLAVPWERALARLAAEGSCFDLIYYDPPYDLAEVERFLAATAPLLAAGGAVLVEHRKRSVPEAAGGLVPVRTLIAGDPAVTFFARP